MENRLVEAFAALSNPVRLDVFRLLARRYPSEVPAGEVGAALGLAASTASAHLAALRSAGLIHDRRAARRILYSMDRAGAERLVEGLLGECCADRVGLPECEAAPEGRLRVLFLCSGNSARSIMAEAVLRHFASDRFEVVSAGMHPAEAVKRQVLDVLEGQGMSIDGLAPKGLEAVEGTRFDFVFTLCDRAANEECGALPGHPVSAHWSIPDPSRTQGTEAEAGLAYRRAFSDIYNRIKGFSNIPVETLSRRARLDAALDIGRMETPE